MTESRYLHPQEGTTFRDLRDKGKKYQRTGFSGYQGKVHTTFSDDGFNPWLSQKFMQRGEAVGITLIITKEVGIVSCLLLMTGVQKTGKQEEVRAQKRKGSRELQGVACSINYERNNSSRGTKSQKLSRTIRRSKGSVKVIYEDLILECAWVGQMCKAGNY